MSQSSSFGYRGFTLNQEPDGTWRITRILTRYTFPVAFPASKDAMEAIDSEVAEGWPQSGAKSTVEGEDDLTQPSDEPASP